MKYLTGQNEDGYWFAAIEDGNPSRLLDKKLCASQEGAESLRAAAVDAGARVFSPAMLAAVKGPPVPVRDPLDHDGDGRKGGSKPKAARK